MRQIRFLIGNYAGQREYCSINEMVKDIDKYLDNSLPAPRPKGKSKRGIVGDVINELQQEASLHVIHSEPSVTYIIVKNMHEDNADYVKRRRALKERFRAIAKQHKQIRELIEREIEQSPEIQASRSYVRLLEHRIYRMSFFISSVKDQKVQAIRAQEADDRIDELIAELRDIERAEDGLDKYSQKYVEPLAKRNTNYGELDKADLASRLSANKDQFKIAEQNVYKKLTQLRSKATDENYNPRLKPFNRRLEKAEKILERLNKKEGQTKNHIDELIEAIHQKYEKELKALLDNESALNL